MPVQWEDGDAMSHRIRELMRNYSEARNPPALFLIPTDHDPCRPLLLTANPLASGQEKNRSDVDER